MENHEVFGKYFSKLRLESIIKSAIMGLIVGFTVSFLIAFICFLCDFSGLWIALGAGLAISAGSGFLFFYKIFLPSIKNAAARLDRQGLEERLITMVGTEGGDSFIVKKQRENAKEKLSSVNPQLKFAISRVSIVALFVAAVMSISMISVNAVLASGHNAVVLPTYYKVKVLSDNILMGTVSGGGEFEENDSVTVTAVAEEEFVFSAWYEDGVKITDPAATDVYTFILTGNRELLAKFEFKIIQDLLDQLQWLINSAKISEELRALLQAILDQLIADLAETNSLLDKLALIEAAAEAIKALLEEWELYDLSDMFDDLFGDIISDILEILDGDDELLPIDPPIVDPEILEGDKIIDGTVDYREVYEAYLEQAKEIIANGGTIPDEIREIIENYFDIIL